MLETHICQLGHGVGFDRHIVLPQLLLDLFDTLRDVLRLAQKRGVKYAQRDCKIAKTDRGRGLRLGSE